jgi:hypothetical protein
VGWARESCSRVEAGRRRVRRPGKPAEIACSAHATFCRVHAWCSADILLDAPSGSARGRRGVPRGHGGHGTATGGRPA